MTREHTVPRDMPTFLDNLPAPPFKRYYEPDSIRIMTDAIDFACRMLPDGVRESESLRRRLATRILHDIDVGERDPMRLATSAVFSIGI